MFGGYWDPPPAPLQRLKKLTLQRFDLSVKIRGSSVGDLHTLFLAQPSIEVLTLEDCWHHVTIPRLLAEGMMGKDVGHDDHSSSLQIADRQILLPRLNSLRFMGYGGTAGNELLGLYVGQLMEMREGLRLITPQSYFDKSQIGLQQLKTRMGERIHIISPYSSVD